MKKTLWLFLVIAICLLPACLTACGGGDVEPPVLTKPVTLTFYGITGDSTTEEAIAAVQDELNLYTEGNFSTHIVLKLYPEAEYDRVIEEKLAEAAAIKAASKNKGNKKSTDTAEASETGAETETETAAVTEAETMGEVYEEYGVTKNVYPEPAESQIDIFMVRGAAKLNHYQEGGHLAGLNDSLNNSYRILKTYISEDLFTTVTIGGKALPTGRIDKGTIYGIPNNNVAGQYTYLLLNRELIDKYYYSPDDIKSLTDLNMYLSDAANDTEYVTLYNKPTIMIDTLSDKTPLIGGVLTNISFNFSYANPVSLFSNGSYRSYLQHVDSFCRAGYVTEGSYDAIPEGLKCAAAFLKGNAALPEQYEDEYYVTLYERPVAHASDRPGTVFCVSSYSANVDRCMDVITALETVPSFRNTFQYGIEGKHYVYDDYTEMVTILNQDYSMDPADTGNLFLLYRNDQMSPETLALAADNWALGKQQNRDTITSPYVMFNFKIITADNYKTESIWYKREYAAALSAAREAANAKGEKFDESTFTFDRAYPFMYTDEILEHLQPVCEEYFAKAAAYEPKIDEYGDVIPMRSYLTSLQKELLRNQYYQLFTDAENPDSPASQYSSWYDALDLN